jgi:uncharacterized protein YuzE
MTDACYIRMSRGKVSRTKQLIRDTIIADYDAQGKLVGIEIIAPNRFLEFTCGRYTNYPNSLTRKAMADVRAGKNKRLFANVDVLFDQLGITWEKP